MPTMRSNERILTTHAGSLPRPALIRELLTARKDGKIAEPARLDAELPAAVREVVAKQIDWASTASMTASSARSASTLI